MTTTQPTQLIGKRYRLVSRIASGGMGDVWKSHDELLDRMVAVKILKKEFTDDDSFLQRFRMEARAAASLSHPGIATVFDYNEELDPSGDRLASLVMELIDGEPLSKYVAHRSHLTSLQTLDIIAQTASALEAAHDRGIVHRDIKPANLLIRKDGSIKITDFGIARAADDVNLTQTGAMLGTVQYMAPEQLSGSRGSSASDIYSLGIVAYFCLVGQTPFYGMDPMAAALAHTRDPIPPLPSTVPGGLRDLVGAMLEKDPKQRPASAGELALMATGLKDAVGEDSSNVADEATALLSPIGSFASTGRESTTVMDAAAVGVGASFQETKPNLSRASLLQPPGSLADMRKKLDTPDHRRKALIILGILLLILLLSRLFSHSTQVFVPALQGRPVSVAISILSKDGLQATKHYESSPGSAPGTVVNQSPQAGTTVGAGAAVTLDVASGYVNVASSAYLGKPYAQASAALSALGLKPVAQAVTSSSPAGNVLKVSPTGQVKVGSTITLQVATPPPTTTTTTTAAPPPAPGPGPGGGGPPKKKGDN